MMKFILILFLIFFLFSVFRRYILFFLVRAVGKSLANQMQARQKQQQRPEGSVTIDTTGAAKGSRHDEGEYTPYEEIK
jgi:hypothetical protein